MGKVIIHKTDEGLLAITRPSAGVDIHKAARQAVKHGKAYKIINESELPSDYTFRQAWTVDDSILTDGFGNSSDKYE
jgi:hypothetical protein